MLDTIAPNLKLQGVEVLLVSVDEPEKLPSAEAFLRDNKIGLYSYMAEPPLSVFKFDLNPRWKGMLPASFLFDAEAMLRHFWAGEAFEDEILPIVEGFLAGKNIDGESNFSLAPGKVNR